MKLLFNKVAVLSREICEILNDTFLNRTRSVAASVTALIITWNFIDALA